MRPVNLIPPEDRRGERAPLRTGPLAYVLVGALAARLRRGLPAVSTGNSITEREASSPRWSRSSRRATARAALQRFTELRVARAAARRATVDPLAQSRFDWERVLRELAFVIPADVWLSPADGVGGRGRDSGARAATCGGR